MLETGLVTIIRVIVIIIIIRAIIVVVASTAAAATTMRFNARGMRLQFSLVKN